MKFQIVLAAIFCGAVPATVLAQAQCDLPMKGTQASQCTDEEKKQGKTSCPRTLLYDKQTIVFSTGFRVNTDGNLRSYAAQDPFGNKCENLPENADPLNNGCAMNTVCNGVSVLVRKNGKTTTVVGHGAKDACATMVPEFNRVRDAKWLPKDGSRVSFGSVIATKGTKGDDRYVPCETNGFLVSMASTLSGLKPKNRCDQAQWLDAAVPSIVIPQCWRASYRKKYPDDCAAVLKAKDFPDVQPGDLVAVRRRAAGAKPVFVLVGDTGPISKIGEASVGFHLERLGTDLKKLPRTYHESVRLDVFEQRFDVVVFPGTALSGVELTPDNFNKMRDASSKAFEKWGGPDGAAVTKLSACASQAAP